MTNEEKAKEIISISNTNQVYGVANFDDLHESLHEDLMEMAKWKDKQSNSWHKVADGDLPEEGGNYWCKLKGEYNQGSSHYKQHCNNGYCILQWLPKKKAWNVRYNTEVEAWIELPKYNEE